THESMKSSQSTTIFLSWHPSVSSSVWSATSMKLPFHFPNVPVQLLRRSQRCRKRSLRRRSILSHFEAIERREMPSNFVVTNTLDHGLGSLRDAMERANANPGSDGIKFSISTSDTNFHDGSGNGRRDSGDFWSIAPTSALPQVTGRLFLD